jgi:AmmeMemoRadiSam system protein B
MKVRQPAVAGMFYPADKEELLLTLDALFAQAEKTKEKRNLNVAGIIAPHAGYVYSGKTAAFAYNTIVGKKYKTVAVVSPSHREYFPGVSVYDGDAYETPLGIIEMDDELRRKLIYNSRYIFGSEQGHRGEHALEVHLPFLQYALENDFKLLPIVMGDQKEGYINELAAKLAEIYDDEILFVASTDLSHYYPRSIAEELDANVERRINAFQFEELRRDVERKLSEACGAGPTIAVMKALHKSGKRNAEVLYRTDSGEASLDFSQVVGYLSAIIY